MRIYLIFILIATIVYGQSIVELKRMGGRGDQPGQFNDPRSLDISETGIIYVADTGNNRIQLLNLKGEILKTVGGFGFEPEQFDQPRDIWARSIINIYVSDYNNQRLQRFDRNMNFISQLTSNTGAEPQFQFYEVGSCAINAQNDLFLLDCGDNKILKFNRNANPERAFAAYEAGIGELKNPVQLDIWKEQYLLISDAVRASVLIYDFYGNFIRALQGDALRSPQGLAVDHRDNIYICDPKAGRIFRVKPDLKQLEPLNFHAQRTSFRPRDIALYRSAAAEGTPKQFVFILSDNELIKGRLKH